MSVPPAHLLRVSALLEGVLSLTQKVVTKRAAWRASATEWEFLLEVSGLTERVLPPEAVDDASSALGFLWFARFRLETSMVTLSSTQSAY
jgi:hypothetical protein